ncbi:ATP binding protein MinD [Syntrophomonas zehnderi OL-4]|uniref:ATP binding protein MinD n=1 Tax=Syntrophomonas zehnderi OL-4 TaxID=690567 RepID=A0A0E4GAR8_9FIRM|nr:MinD/ParA family protein [Syntrophomonas zehnderi]CFX65990.1 ATP binding protein MinD [Syntrophomonas zehnderi OL-4]
MRDQADKLREMALNLKNQIEAEIGKDNKKQTRVIVVSSGKGGVGKSTLALNLSLSLSILGKNVILLDADLGMANIDIMLGLVPQYNLYHIIKGNKTLKDIIVNGPAGLRIIPGGSGLDELANLNDEELNRILVEMGKLDGECDFMIVDTGAGISNNVIRFLLAADDVIILTTPEPTSLTDAYGTVKSIARNGFNGSVFLVVNRVSKETEGVLVAQKFKLVGEKFLDLDIKILGHILHDPQVESGIRRQEAFIQAYPNSIAAKNIMYLAEKLIDEDNADNVVKPLPVKKGGIRGFFKKVTSYKQP